MQPLSPQLARQPLSGDGRCFHAIVCRCVLCVYTRSGTEHGPHRSCCVTGRATALVAYSIVLPRIYCTPAFSFDSSVPEVIPIQSAHLVGTQRTVSNGPDSAAGGGGEGGSSGENADDATGGQQGVGGAARGAGTQQPAGRGRGAFSQYLRTHEVRTCVPLLQYGVCISFRDSSILECFNTSSSLSTRYTVATDNLTFTPGYPIRLQVAVSEE